MAQTPRPADAVRIGQVFLGKYRVESIIGQGGMGVVAECTHLQLNQRLAIKMLRQDVLADADAVERFMREAQAASKLRSEYVAHVSDVGRLENGTPYMVMEFLEGMDLGALITDRGKLAIPWACDLMMQTAEALAEAHSLGIVHRDIKPTNLFVTWRPDGTALVKVLDFGISKSTMGTDMQLTQTQSLLGTPAYMSPEQMRSARLVDARTDIWSLGSVMYELLEGRKPFEAESFSEMCVKVAVDPPAPMLHTPPELQHVVLRCLAKSPEQRYSTMADFARDLVPFVADPHQASLLVERMQRMLRRSVGDGNWDGLSTGAGQRSVPNHVRDGSASQPIRVPWQNEGSAPSSRAYQNTPIPAPLHAPGTGPVPRMTGTEPSAPAYMPPEMMTPARKRHTALWVVIVMALLIGTGVGIGLSVGGGGDEQKPTTRRAATTQPETKPTETKPAETKPTETKAVDTTETKPVETKAVDTTEAKAVEPTETKAVEPTETKAVEPTEAKAVDTTETKAVDTTETKAVEPTETKGTGTKAIGTKAAGTKAVGTKAVGTKTVGTKTVGTKAVGAKAGQTGTGTGTGTGTAAGSGAVTKPVKKCDPFDNAHAEDCKK